jgi:hypothetical protein
MILRNCILFILVSYTLFRIWLEYNLVQEKLNKEINLIPNTKDNLVIGLTFIGLFLEVLL